MCKLEYLPLCEHNGVDDCTVVVFVFGVHLLPYIVQFISQLHLLSSSHLVCMTTVRNKTDFASDRLNTTKSGKAHTASFSLLMNVRV